MKRFKRILYYTDLGEGSRAALERAAELALRNRGRLTVMGVTRPPHDLQLLEPILPPVELQDLMTQDLRERLDRFVAPVREKGLRPDVEALTGTPFIEVTRRVLDHGHDLVIVSADEGRGGIAGPHFGSTSLHLLRKCPCPVWVLRQGPHRRFERILAAVNPDPCDEDHLGVSTEIMRLATSLARLEGSELRVVHAWSHPAEDVLRRSSRLTEADIERVVRDTGKAHGAWLHALLARHPLNGDARNVHLLPGDPSEAIIDLVAAKNIDLIVMGTVARTGVAGLLMGDTAETVLSQVGCSVLTVKPKGFVSPVGRVEKNGHPDRTGPKESSCVN